MERYDQGEQENLVLKIFRLKIFFWHTLKAQKPKKLKMFKICCGGIVVKIWSRGVVLNIYIFFVLTTLVMKEVSAKM